MRIEIDHEHYSTQLIACVIHNEEKIEWQCNFYKQNLRKSQYDPFKQINNYWARLPIERQNEIFQLFREAKRIFNEYRNISDYTRFLTPITNRLAELHYGEEFQRWVRFQSNIWIPSDLNDVYVERQDIPSTRAQTYLLGDYRELATMALSIRPLSVIFSEFIERLKKDVRSSFKELMTFELIATSVLMRCPAMDRLRLYIDSNIKTDEINKRLMIEGIGTEDFKPWTLALIVVKNLGFANLEKDERESNLASLVHRVIKSVQKTDSNQINAIRDKSTPLNSDDDDMSSRYENYKNKQDVPTGDIVIIEEYTKRTREIARRLLPESVIDDQTLDQLLTMSEKCCEVFHHEDIQTPQRKLSQLVLHPIVSYRAQMYISKIAMVRLMSITQVTLWVTGFPYLAVLSTATSRDEDGDFYISETRTHFSKDLFEELNRLYPYQRKPLSPGNIPKSNNHAVKSITKMESEFSEHTWFLNAPDAWIAQVTGSELNKTHRTNHEIRSHLARLAIYIQERNKEFIHVLFGR